MRSARRSPRHARREPQVLHRILVLHAAVEDAEGSVALARVDRQFPGIDVVQADIGRHLGLSRRELAHDAAEGRALLVGLGVELALLVGEAAEELVAGVVADGPDAAEDGKLVGHLGLAGHQLADLQRREHWSGSA